MKVKFLCSIAGADVCFLPGQTAVLAPEIARPWVASGIAEAINESAAEPAETPDAAEAATPRKKGRR